MDVQVKRAITNGLRTRGVDVLTAQEDGSATLSDPELLDRATALGRALFTRDEDFLEEAARRQQSDEHFAGVVYVHQLKLNTGKIIAELELLAQAGEPADVADRVIYLPL